MTYLRQHLWSESEEQFGTMFGTMFFLFNRQKAAILSVQTSTTFFRRLYIVPTGEQASFVWLTMIKKQGIKNILFQRFYRR
tara:strand:- start:272 stop:514 length:243 start_codon:yes stop_codon:yes gene_type:complete